MYNFFGEDLNKVDAAMDKGIMYKYFGGRTTSLTELRLAVKPKGIVLHCLHLQLPH